MKFLPFVEARSYVRKLGLKSSKEWRKFCNSGNKPDGIPTSPERSYQREWNNWGDWLGTGNVSSRNRKYRTFQEARKYVHSLGLSTIQDWKEFSKSGKRPLDIPAKPHILYKKLWKNWFDLSIYNANRSKAYFTYGGHSTKAGMVDELFRNRPRILVVDELETMPAHDQISLLGLCENGILAETKITKTRQTQMNTWVFATGNSTKKILPPLLSRFIVLNVKKPARDEFIDIGKRILIEKEGIDPTIALYIASQVYDNRKNADLRDVIKIARASNGEARKINLLIDIMSDGESK